GAAQRSEARRAVRDSEGDRVADRRGSGSSLGAAAGPRRAPGGPVRRRGPAADDPPRHVLARSVRSRRPARARQAVAATAGPDRRSRRPALAGAHQRAFDCITTGGQGCPATSVTTWPAESFAVTV